jgi:hypothetical protein
MQNLPLHYHVFQAMQQGFRQDAERGQNLIGMGDLGLPGIWQVWGNGDSKSLIGI